MYRLHMFSCVLFSDCQSINTSSECRMREERTLSHTACTWKPNGKTDLEWRIWPKNGHFWSPEWKVTSNFGTLSPCYCYWKDFKFWWSAQGDIWDSAIKTRIMRAYLKNNIWQVRDPGASIRWLPVGVLVSRRMCFTMKANCQSRVSEVVYFH